MKKIILVCFLSLFIGCLGSEEEDLHLPAFISKEITGLIEFSNFNLCTHPYSKWEKDYLTSLENS